MEEDNDRTFHPPSSILVFIRPQPYPTTTSASRVVSAIHHMISRGVMRPKNIAAETRSRLDRVIESTSCDSPTFDNALMVTKSTRSPGICGSDHRSMI